MRLDRRDLHELTKLRRAHQALRFECAALKRDLLLRKYNPSQPRLPAGQPGGGQWVGANSSGATGGGLSPSDIGMGGDAATLADALSSGAGDTGNSTQTAFLQALPAGVVAMGEMLMMGLALFESMSRQNGPDSQAILQFNAREFNPATQTGLMLEAVRSLNRDEVQAYCPRLVDVQTRTDRIAEEVSTYMPNVSQQRYGTEVHKRLADEINGLDDRTYVAEQSILKSEMAQRLYGAKGSIRIDVLEEVNRDTVCVYDIKTGERGLSLPRSIELASEIFKVFKMLPTRIIVTEVRPFK